VPVVERDRALLVEDAIATAETASERRRGELDDE